MPWGRHAGQSISTMDRYRDTKMADEMVASERIDI